MRILLAVLMLALATLAIPSSSAAEVEPPVYCWDGIAGSECGATVGPCSYVAGYSVITESSYSRASCSTEQTGYCEVDLTTLDNPPIVTCEDYGPGDESSAAALALPCHRNASNDQVCHVAAAGCTVDTYSYDMEDALNQYTVDCWGCGAHYGGGPLVRGDCYTPPPIASSTAAEVAPPGLPCQTGIAGSWCTVGAAHCVARVGYQTGSEQYEYAGVYCGPPTWYPCTVVYVDTQGNVESCYFVVADTSSQQAQPPCQNGFGSSWCRVSAGGCTATVFTYTAWGDRWAELDCAGGGAGPTCHAEVHMDHLANEHWCAF